MTCQIDYLSMTFKETPAEVVQGFFARFFPVMAAMRGHHGYRNCWRAEGCAVYYDGMDGMGVHVQVSGVGCAAVGSHASFVSWGAFVDTCIERGATGKRVDFAFDDRSGLVTVARVREHLDGGKFASKWREWGARIQRGRGELKADVIYIGGAKSDSTLCVYDKRLEQMSKGEDDPGTWVRCELRLKDDAAGAAWAWMSAHPNLEGVEGLLRQAIDFKDDDDDTNRTRRKSAGWWQEFLHNAGKIRLVVVKPARSVAYRCNQFVRQHSATLAMLAIATESLGLTQGFAQEVYNSGLARLKAKHLDNVAQWLNGAEGNLSAAGT